MRKDFDIEEYLRLGPAVRRAADEYFANAAQIEAAWKVLLQERFCSQEHKDKFWGLCQKGMQLAWKWRTAEIQLQPYLAPPRRLPCYTRAIMLLEREERFSQAVVLCDEALKWAPDSDWYPKKKSALQKKAARHQQEQP